MNNTEMQRFSFDVLAHVAFGHIDTETSMLQSGR